MKIRFSTAAYIRSHGRKPHGPGRYGFLFGGSDGEYFFASSNLTFTAAKKQAADAAFAQGVTFVEVAP